MQLIQDQEIQSVDDDVFSDKQGTQYLSFVVGEEEFSVNILRVQEIRAWEVPTFLPNSPAFILGVLNLRGTIVPVMDLRVRFGFRQFNYDPTTVVIILKNTKDGKECLMGCVVDAVSDVFNVDESKIKDAPDHFSSVDNRFIGGIMTVDKQPVTLLNLVNLLELNLIEHRFAGKKAANG